MIAIIGFTDLHIMQYLYKYTNILDNAGIQDYEVIFWNRAGGVYDKTFAGNAVAYEVPLNTYLPFWKKVSAFVRYTTFVRKQIRKKKYEKLIILTTPTAIPLADLLIGKYKNRYIFDYRDISKEDKSKAYTELVRLIIDKSYMTPMSSYGFLDILGLSKSNAKILLAHNTQKITNTPAHLSHHKKNAPLRISFWGMVRQADFNCKLCDVFGNDKRFMLSYHGEGATGQIQQYCLEQGYTNINFSGRYKYSEVEHFAEQTDIIHCIYEFQTDVTMKPAMQVKVYDAMKFRLPILLHAGSYSAQYVKKFGIAFEVNPDEGKKIADEIYEWYQNLDMDVVNEGFSKMADIVHQDDVIFQHKVLEFCGVEKNENSYLYK